MSGVQSKAVAGAMPMRLRVGIAPLLLTKRFSFSIENLRTRAKGACSPKKKTTMY